MHIQNIASIRSTMDTTSAAGTKNIAAQQSKTVSHAGPGHWPYGRKLSG